MEELLKIITNGNNDYSCLPEFKDEFEKICFKYYEIDSNEDLEDNTSNINWYNTFKIIKNDKEYIINISGTAIADISYDRWVDSYGFSIDRDSISIEELNNFNDLNI